jgi:hypothetical protein
MEIISYILSLGLYDICPYGIGSLVWLITYEILPLR